MTRCGACGFEYGGGMRFCGGCGTRLPSACPSCAFENPPEFRFCGACGTALAGTTQTPAGSAALPQGGIERTPPARVERGDAERRQLTVLFCDLVDSAGLAERLDAEEYREFVRRYQGACADVVQRFDGHVAQYLGDGLLVYFGFPRAHEDDARRAGHAALGILEAMQTLSIPAGAGARPSVRIGVHTGPVIAGEVGAAGATQERLALGSTPNIAARLQALADPDTVLLSGETERLLHGWFELESRGPQQLKGITRPVVVHRLLREARRSGRFELDDARRLTPLVGRDEERALLTRRLASAREGNGHIVLLSGEAGVGKSRLVQALRTQAVEDGFTCLVGRSTAVHQGSPLLPLVELVEGLLGLDAETSDTERLRRVEAHVDALDLPRAETVPLLATLLSVPTGDAYAPVAMLAHKQRSRTFELLLTLLARGAEQRPVAFVMEDLHWADASTLEFLALFVSQPPIPRLLAVFTVRTDHALPWSGRSHVTHLTLSRLGDQDVRRIIEHMAGEHRLPTALVRQVVQKTDGIPVFVEELTRMVLDLGLVEGGGPVDPASLLPLLDIPETLQDSLLARLDRMGDAKEVAQIGAVLGRAFPYDLLLAVSAFDETELQEQLARLVDAELLYQRGVVPNATFTFKHALLQDAAYGLLLRSTRRMLHERVAETLRTQFPAIAVQQPELLAHHYTEAGRVEPAVGSWLQAGMHSLMRSANVEAVTALRRGLALLGEITDPGQRMSLELGLLTTLGAAHVSTMGYNSPEAVQAYARATELCEILGDVPELFWAVRGVWGATQTRGDLVRSRDIGFRLLRLADAADADALRMEAHYCIAASCMFIGELAMAREHFTQLAALDRPGRDTTGRMYAALDVAVAGASLHAQTVWIAGERDEAHRMAADAIALGTAIKHPLSHAFALNQAATIGYHEQDREMARRHAQEILRLSEEYGTFFAPIAGMWLGWAESDPTAVQAAFAQHAMSGMRIGNTMFHCVLADARHGAGDLVGAAASVAAGLEDARANDEHYWEPELLRIRALLARADDRTADADADLQAAIAIAQRTGAAALEDRCRRALVTLVEPAA